MEHIGELDNINETPRMDEIRDEEMKAGLEAVDKADPMDPLMQQAHLEMRIDYLLVRKIWPYFFAEDIPTEEDIKSTKGPQIVMKLISSLKQGIVTN